MTRLNQPNKAVTPMQDNSKPHELSDNNTLPVERATVQAVEPARPATTPTPAMTTALAAPAGASSDGVSLPAGDAAKPPVSEVPVDLHVVGERELGERFVEDETAAKALAAQQLVDQAQQTIGEKAGLVADDLRVRMADVQTAPAGAAVLIPEVKPDATDHPSSETPDSVDISGLTFRGMHATLWKMLREGATHAEMMAKTGWDDCLAAVESIAQQTGTTIRASGQGENRTYRAE